MLDIYTSNIRCNDPDKLDITVKSGQRYFAPTWEMVMGVKRGTMTHEEYDKRYEAMLDQNKEYHPKPLHALLARKRVVFVCYCPSNNVHCHRRFLAKWLVANFPGQCEYKGEI